MWGKMGFQTEYSRGGIDWRSSSRTCTSIGIASDGSFIGDSPGSVFALTLPSNTNFRALRVSLSKLHAARGKSPSVVHPACPCAGRVAGEVTVLRRPRGCVPIVLRAQHPLGHGRIARRRDHFVLRSTNSIMCPIYCTTRSRVLS